MESELETMQVESARLKDEMETKKKTCSGMELQIETLTTEVCTLNVNIPDVLKAKLI